MMKREVISVFDAIQIYGHDEDYIPKRRPKPCPHGPGCIGRLLELSRRLELGQVLSIPEDNHVAATPEEQKQCGIYCRGNAKQNRDTSPLKGTGRNQYGVWEGG